MNVLGAMAVLCAALLVATPAAAYIGPGAGLGALGAIAGLLFGVIVAIGVVLLWPIRAVWRKLRGPAPTAERAESQAPASDS